MFHLVISAIHYLNQIVRNRLATIGINLLNIDIKKINNNSVRNSSFKLNSIVSSISNIMRIFP